jgi:hypothetical protein
VQVESLIDSQFSSLSNPTLESSVSYFNLELRLESFTLHKETGSPYTIAGGVILFFSSSFFFRVADLMEEVYRMSTTVVQAEPEMEVRVSDKKTEDAPSKIFFKSLRTPQWLRKLNDWIENLAGFEARGITRITPEERQAPSIVGDIQMALLWFSANISVNNLAVGLYGPLAFNLGFLDCAMCAVFGGLLGSMSTGYMSTWGPQSGNRTMVSTIF